MGLINTLLFYHLLFQQRFLSPLGQRVGFCFFKCLTLIHRRAPDLESQCIHIFPYLFLSSFLPSLLVWELRTVASSNLLSFLEQYPRGVVTDATPWVSLIQVQLTFEQHRFELLGSTYMQIFSSNFFFVFGLDHFSVLVVELLGFQVARAFSSIKRTLKRSFLLARYFLTSGTQH